MTVLSKRKCLPCEAGAEPISEEQANKLLSQLGEGWSISDGKLTCGFSLKDFKTAMNFADKIGELAENEGHHPDLLIAYGKVKVILYTHSIGGLSENDFILAAKINTLSV